MLIREYLDQKVEEGIVHKGIIEDFECSFGSGIALITIGGESIPCENPNTVRALDNAFGDVILPGHMVNKASFVGKEVYYLMDGLGLVFQSFTRADSPDMDEEVVLDQDFPVAEDRIYKG